MDGDALREQGCRKIYKLATRPEGMEHTESDGEFLLRLVDEARKWAEETVRAIRSERTVTCIFCGQAYDKGTPDSQDAVLYEHIKVCEKHPLRAAEQKIKEQAEELRIWHKADEWPEEVQELLAYRDGEE